MKKDLTILAALAVGAPKTGGDAPRGPVGASPLDESTWKNAPGIPVSGGGTWTSYIFDTKTGQLYVPGGNPVPDFVQGGLDGANAREGQNLYSDSRQRLGRAMTLEVLAGSQEWN